MSHRIEVKNQSVVNISQREKRFLESALKEFRKLHSEDYPETQKTIGEIVIEVQRERFGFKTTPNIWVDNK